MKTEKNVHNFRVGTWTLSEFRGVLFSLKVELMRRRQ